MKTTIASAFGALVVFEALIPVSATFSIVAMDLANGCVGCALSSCVGDRDLLPACGGIPGVGVVAATGWSNEPAVNKTVELLNTNRSSTSIISALVDTAFDPLARFRQYQVCGIGGGETDCDTWTGTYDFCEHVGYAGNVRCFSGIVTSFVSDRYLSSKHSH